MLIGRLLLKIRHFPLFKTGKRHLSAPLADLRRMAESQARTEPLIMRLDTPAFRALLTPEVLTLVDLFEKHSHEIRIAGGAVRDLLGGDVAHDVDFATTATPDEMLAMFEAAGVRTLNANGLRHGTVTARINDAVNFEVTTLRIDMLTDGRHAQVQFTKDWLLDAMRRDLTFNAMFLGLDGAVYDYFYGYEDLQAGRVRFVGDARTRIREDYLRILRYFRFYGRIAPRSDDHEDETLEAIRENVTGLANISGERIWMELKKILAGNYAGELLKKMVECGIGPFVGLPENPPLTELERVWKRGNTLQSITLLSALLENLDDCAKLNSRLKLSVYERELCAFIVANRSIERHPKPLLPYQRWVATTKGKGSDMREWVIELLKYTGSDLLDDFLSWELPKFPVNGNMLKEAGVPAGRMMGSVLDELKARWAECDFKLTDKELLEIVPEILEMSQKKKRKK